MLPYVILIKTQVLSLSHCEAEHFWLRLVGLFCFSATFSVTVNQIQELWQGYFKMNLACLSLPPPMLERSSRPGNFK